MEDGWGRGSKGESRRRRAGMREEGREDGREGKRDRGEGE